MRWAILSLALLLSAAAALLRWGTGLSASTAVQRPHEPHRIAAPGLVEPRSGEIALGSELSGTIAAVLVVRGQRVLRGQPLLRLEDSTLRAQLATAQMEAAARQSELDRLMHGARPEEIALAGAKVAAAEASAAFASKEYRRVASLHEVAAPQRLDEARHASDVANAQLEASRQELALLKEPPREEDRRLAEARLAAANARVAEARAWLERATLRAPIDSTVLDIYHQSGELVLTSEYMPLLLLGDLSQRRVRAEFADDSILHLRSGLPAFVQTDFNGEHCQGRVGELGLAALQRSVPIQRSTERIDYRVVPTWVDLEPSCVLPIGLRVDVFVCLKTETCTAPSLK